MRLTKPFRFVFLLIPLLCWARTPNWEIVTLNHQLYQNVVFNQLSGDTLVVQAYGKTFEISVDSIETIRDVNGFHSHAVLGFLIGAAGGGIIGFNQTVKKDELTDVFMPMFGELDRTINTGVGIIFGGLVGVFIGSRIKTQATYNIQKMDHSNKIEAINQLMQPYELKPIFEHKK